MIAWMCYAKCMNRPPIDQCVTFVYTHDLSASIAFYEGVLGLPLVLDQGACRIYGVAGGAYVGICRRDDAPAPGAGPPNNVILTLVTADVDGWHRYLAARGIIFEQPPQYNPRFNIYHCFLRDPAGYVIEIQRFLDPSWPAGEAG